MTIVIGLITVFLSFFGYDVVESGADSCEVNGVYMSRRPEFLYASVVDNGQAQTYVWTYDSLSLDAPVLQEVLPFTEEFSFAEIAVISHLDIIQAVADDDEIIFLI